MTSKYESRTLEQRSAIDWKISNDHGGSMTETIDKERLGILREQYASSSPAELTAIVRAYKHHPKKRGDGVAEEAILD